MAVFLHERLRRNIYRRKLSQRVRPIPRKSMDQQVCASYICFLIYLVAHRKARIFPPRVDGAGSGVERRSNPRENYFTLMTLSALASTLGGIVRPICFAALRLMINSNFVGCSTGSSAGFAPLRILSTYVAARRNKASSLTP